MKPIKYRDVVLKLSQAINLPNSLAVVKCQGHGKDNDWVTWGNDTADQAAKRTAGYPQERKDHGWIDHGAAVRPVSPA